MTVAMKREGGSLVRDLRQQHRLSQNRLAALTGLHTQTIMKAELANVVTWRTAKRLGDVLGVDPRELVTRE